MTTSDNTEVIDVILDKIACEIDYRLEFPSSDDDSSDWQGGVIWGLGIAASIVRGCTIASD